ncbi:MAG: tyrosine-type recombinase/integrase [Chitinophagaceae bacterium]|nr:tyrosine-type recombinase/integrase [Chitinophagaceae bacterium]
MKKEQLAFVPEFLKFIRKSASGARRLPSGKKFSKGSLVQYRTVYRLLQGYEKTYDTTLSITLHRRFSVAVLRREKLYWNRFFREFSFYLYRRGCYDTYVAAVYKVIRTFFHYLQTEKGFPVSQFYLRLRVPVVSGYPVVLTPDQLRYLITDTVYREGLPEHLKRTLDIFVFGCTTALRYSDLMELRKSSLQFRDNAAWLVTHTRKTGAEIRLPLPDYAVGIIRRWWRSTGVYVLPRLSGTNLNLQIRELIRRAGWDYVMPKIRHLRGLPVEIKRTGGGSYRFCDHITIHSARRTAITTLLLLGVEENIVRRISGHAPGSREFYKYVGLVHDFLQKQVCEAYRRLVE